MSFDWQTEQDRHRWLPGILNSSSRLEAGLETSKLFITEEFLSTVTLKITTKLLCPDVLILYSSIHGIKM